MSAILTVQGVEKSFGTRVVLGGVSFALHAHDRVGVVGLNGSGKSTLLRMVVAAARAEETPELGPDAGRITKRRDLSIGYVPQEPRLDPARAIGDILGERLPAHEVRELRAALSLPPLEATAGTLSIGERRRVALAQALGAAPELLVLDEPTNHLDSAAVEWIEGQLTSLAGALLLVTHDRYFLDRVATRILELDRGRLHAYEGNYTAFLEKQAERLEQESARERERAAFVRRELAWIQRGPKARTTKQQARVDRFEAAVAAEPGAAERPAGRMTLRLPLGARLGKSVLELRGVTKRGGGKVLFQGLDLLVQPGERIGVVGPNGAGKTTLLCTVLGQVAPDEGQVVVGPSTRFAHLDQARADLRDDRTVAEEVAGDHDRVIFEDGALHIRTFLRQLLFDDGFADTPVGALSGGERSRVQLAKLLRAGGNFFVLDEPTNDLDLVTLGVLEEALVDFPGCALVVSHDRWFLDRVATSILAFEGDGRVTRYEGNYSMYLALRPAPAPALREEKARPARREQPRKLTYREKQELASIEEVILAAEAQVAELEATLADGAVYRQRPAEVPALIAALEEARREVERLYARWQELEARSR